MPRKQNVSCESRRLMEDPQVLEHFIHIKGCATFEQDTEWVCDFQILDRNHFRKKNLFCVNSIMLLNNIIKGYCDLILIN